jgi:Flp pilus assembly protein TadD
MKKNTVIISGLLLSGAFWTSCRTLESGAKVVDKNRGEIVISAPANSMTAMPEGRKDGSITKARLKLEASVKENPKDTASLVSLAQLQLAQDSISEAEETAHRALLLDTKNQGARKVLAQAAIKRGKHDLALIFLSALGGEDSKDSDILNMLGIIALSRNDSDDAMRLWKTGLTLNPGDISVRMNLGVMYLKNRLFSQASTQFERVLKVAPKHQDARLHLGIIEMSRGKNVEALETFKSIVSADKSNQLALFNMAVAQRNLSLYEDAVDSLKRYIKASPGKSAQTDQAFAMIDDINTILAANNQKVSDEDLQSLAGELASRPQPGKAERNTTQPDVKLPVKHAPPAATEASTKNLPVKKAEATTNRDKAQDSNVTDSEIDALEKQLKSPAH